jgi:hypothetical protein
MAQSVSSHAHEIVLLSSAASLLLSDSVEINSDILAQESKLNSAYWNQGKAMINEGEKA